jgi:hypothetical protein
MAAWLILMTHRLPLAMVLFEVISAFATCGLSLGITGELNLFGRFLLNHSDAVGPPGCVDDCDGFGGQRRGQDPYPLSTGKGVDMTAAESLHS